MSQQPDYPPFMNAYNSLSKIFDKIKEAKTPDRFSQDFLATVLGFNGGSYKPFIPLAKRLGFLSSDGVPTELYKQFRNPALSEQAMSKAIKTGYPQLYKRNEFAHALDKKALEGLVMESTGLEKDTGTLSAIVNTFLKLKSLANFELKELESTETQTDTGEKIKDKPNHIEAPKMQFDKVTHEGKLQFSYTIYLNLPETTDPAVFNAIFKSLKENLLQ